MTKSNEDLFIERAITKEIIIILLEAARMGRGTGGLTTEQITQQVNKVRYQLKLAIEEGKRLKEEERAGVEG